MLVGTKPREMSGKVFKSDPDRAFGRESRSLKACYELYEVGPHHMEFGVCPVTYIDSISYRWDPPAFHDVMSMCHDAISIKGLKT